jgi:hypothetical protein
MAVNSLAQNPLRTSGRRLVEYKTLWTTNGSGNMTKVFGPGVTSFNYNSSTGKFKVTFNSQVTGTLVDATIVAHGATGQSPYIGSVVLSTWSATNKTVEVEFWDLATPSLASPSATNQPKCSATFTFTNSVNL